MHSAVARYDWDQAEYGQEREETAEGEEAEDRTEFYGAEQEQQSEERTAASGDLNQQFLENLARRMKVKDAGKSAFSISL